MHYCSLGCYRSHGESCTEGFYKDQMRATLRSEGATTEQKLDMMQKLKRFEAADAASGGVSFGDGSGGSDDGECDDDDEEGADNDGATERLTRLLERAEIDESELTESERAEFRRLLADGSLGAELQAQPAWWAALPADATLVVADCGGGSRCWRWSSEAAASAAESAGAPPVMVVLPALASLTRRAPPPSLAFNLLEVLCAYTYTFRLFCGGLADDAPGATASLLMLSSVLNGEQAKAYPSPEEALLAFARSAEEPSVATSPAFGAACLHDVLALLQRSGLVALALASTTALASAALKCARCGGDGDGGMPASAVPEARERLLHAKKKCHFLEVWWVAYSEPEHLSVLATLRFGLAREMERREEVRVAAGQDRDEARGRAAAPARGPAVQEVS